MTKRDTPRKQGFHRARERFGLSVATYSPENPRNDHAQIFPLLDGRLLLVWCEYYIRSPHAVGRSSFGTAGSPDDAPCRLTGRVSADGGRTWSERLTVQENVGSSNVKHPNLVRLPDQSVLLFFTQWDRGDSADQERSIHYRRSFDDCDTWGPVERLTKPRSGFYILDAGRIFVHSSGRVILPAYWTDEVNPERSNLRMYCYYSDDDGATWQDSHNRISIPGRGAMEPAVIERKDGTLLAILRSDQGVLYRTTSADRGDSWDEAVPTQLSSIQSEACLRRLPDGEELLLLWNHATPYGMTEGKNVTHHPRNPLTAAISYDDGETWTRYQDVENRLGWSSAYPNVYFHRHSDLGWEALVTFYQKSEAMTNVSSLELRIFPVDWFREDIATPRAD